MSALGGPIAELLASLGAVAAGGTFIGTLFSLVSGSMARLDVSRSIERIAIRAAEGSVWAVLAALFEEALG